MSLQIGAINPQSDQLPEPTEVTVTDTIVRDDGTTVTVQKTIRKTPVIRKRTMADVRAQEWVPFGMNLMSDLEEQAVAEGAAALSKGGKVGGAKYVETEGAINFELGSTDPIEKKARDEITRITNDMAKQPMKSEEVIKLRKRIENLEKNLIEYRKGGAPSGPTSEVVVSSTPASPTAASPTSAGGSKATWADRNREKKGLPAARPAASGPPGAFAVPEGAIVEIVDVATGKKIKINKCNLRLTNLGTMSEAELDRIIGYESVYDLPRAARRFYPAGEDGSHKGYAFVSYNSVRDAEYVRDFLNGKKFKGGIIAVDFSEARK